MAADCTALFPANTYSSTDDEIQMDLSLMGLYLLLLSTTQCIHIYMRTWYCNDSIGWFYPYTLVK